MLVDIRQEEAMRSRKVKLEKEKEVRNTMLVASVPFHWDFRRPL